MRIIDVHTHIYDQKDFTSKEKVYLDYFKRAKNRVKKIIVMGWFESNFEELIKDFNKKDNLFLTGSIDMDKDIKNQLDNLEKFFIDKKLFGIKLYPGYQYFYPSDEKVFPIAEFCQKYNKPLIFHSGDVYDPKGKALLKYAKSIHIDELAVKFPKCKIIISHFGFPYLFETANIVIKNENVFTEISGTLDEGNSKKEEKEMLNQYIEDLKKILKYYPNIKKKIMFGTDFVGEETPLHEVERYIQLVKRVFNKKEQENIFYNLAEKIYFEN